MTCAGTGGIRSGVSQLPFKEKEVVYQIFQGNPYYLFLEVPFVPFISEIDLFEPNLEVIEGF